MAEPKTIRTHATRWDTLGIIGGALLALLAAMTLALPLGAPWSRVMWGLVGLGATVLASGLALAWRRLARRTTGLAGTDARRWPRRAPWTGLLLALAAALLWWMPPAPWRWVSWALPLLALAGVWRLAGDLARHGAPAAYRRAARAHARGDEDAAWQAVLEAERDRPDFAALYLLQAQLSRQRGDLAASERAARQYVALSPDAYHGHAELGLTQLAQGNLADATSALERAAALAPFLPEGSLNLGLAYIERGDRGLAIDSLARALRLGLADEVGETIAHYHLWRALHAEGRTQEAERERRTLRRRRRVLRAWHTDLAQTRLQGASLNVQREKALLREIEQAVLS
jgi:tetratricopeptide (TPR) repeat protein